MISQLPDSKPSLVFGSFLESAVRMSDEESVRLIERYLLGLKLNTAGSESVRDQYLQGNSGASAFLELLLRLRKQDRRGSWTCFSTSVMPVSLGLHILLTIDECGPHFDPATHTPSKAYYCDTTNHQYSLGRRPSTQLTGPISAHLITDLLTAFPNQNLNKGTTMANPLFIAVNSKSVVAVNALLNSGRVQINGTTYYYGQHERSHPWHSLFARSCPPSSLYCYNTVHPFHMPPPGLYTRRYSKFSTIIKSRWALL
jgi:hypothetical protein